MAPSLVYAIPFRTNPIVFLVSVRIKINPEVKNGNALSQYQTCSIKAGLDLDTLCLAPVLYRSSIITVTSPHLRQLSSGSWSRHKETAMREPPLSGILTDVYCLMYAYPTSPYLRLCIFFMSMMHVQYFRSGICSVQIQFYY